MKNSKNEDATLVVRSMTVGQLADKIDVPSGEIILCLLRKGVVCGKNQALSEDLVAELARHYEFDTVVPQVEQEDGVSSVTVSEGKENRAPVVVVVGHVDHGKTTLLDYIRRTRVALREKGGITQHLGSYKVTTPQGEVVFLDTPGHEAFSLMRLRGVGVADIVVLIVAADDGVMPQTVEAINFAKEVGVPIVVAINKVDRVEPARLEEIKTQLSKYDLLVEDWGGEVICVPISAKEGTGVDKLLEMIGLQSELLELKTSKSGPAVGYILESKIERGRGSVATIILQSGSAKIGDYFIAGAVVGRINSIIDSNGCKLNVLEPINPAQVAGFTSLPQAGDRFSVVSFDEYKKVRSGKVVARIVGAPVSSGASVEDSIKVLVKADTNSSKEAIVSAIDKLSKSEKKNVVVVFSGVGAITESDVDLASTVKALVYGFGVKPELHVQALAKKLGVVVSSFYVIYHLLDDIKKLIEASREPEKIEKKVGEATVLKVFKIKGSVIAGCYVNSGKIVKGGKIVVLRGKNKVAEGTIKTLQKERRAAKEVATGFECGFVAPGVDDVQVDDRVECFIEEIKNK